MVVIFLPPRISSLALDDDLAALGHALAFIDEFTDAPPPAQGAASPFSALHAIDAALTATPKKKKRVYNPQADACRRMRRKEERLALYRQVKKLQRQLARARVAFQPAVTDREQRTAKRRLELLLEEQRKLQASRMLNAHLKEALLMQIVLGHKLQALAGGFSLSVGRNLISYVRDQRRTNTLVFVKPTRRQAAFPPHRQSSAWVTMQSLSTRPCLHQSATPTACRQSPISSARRPSASTRRQWSPRSCCRPSHLRTTRIKLDPVVGAYTENRTFALLGGGLAVVADLIDRDCVWTKFPVSRAEMVAPKTTAFKRAQMMDVIVEGTLHRFHALGVLFRSREAGQIVVSYCILLFHVSGKLCFREGDWMVVWQSTHQHECVFRGLSRLASEILGDESVHTDQEISQARAAGMWVLSEETKIKLEAVQRKLLVGTERSDLVQLLPGTRPDEVLPHVLRK